MERSLFLGTITDFVEREGDRRIANFMQLLGNSLACSLSDADRRTFDLNYVEPRQTCLTPHPTSQWENDQFFSQNPPTEPTFDSHALPLFFRPWVIGIREK